MSTKTPWYKTFLPDDASKKELDALQFQIKSLQDKVEEESIETEIRALESKGLDNDYTSTGTKSDFSSIDEDISKAELQKLMVTETWFFIVVNAIAQTISALPPKLEQKKKVEREEMDQDGKLIKTSQESWIDASGEPEFNMFLYPNKIQPAIEFYWLLILDLLATGDAFIYIDEEDLEVTSTPYDRLRQSLNSVKGNVKNLYRLNSSNVEVVPGKDGKFIDYYGMQTNSGYMKFEPKCIIHIKMPNPINPLCGLAPIVASLKNLLIDRYTKEHMIRFYKQGARLGGVIKTKQKLTKEQLTRLERTFESNYTGRQNHHRTLVLPQEMEYQTIEQNPGETSLIEFMKHNKEPILAVYNVPPVKVGILDGASYANALVQMKIYYTDTIRPILTLIEQHINLHPNILPEGKNLRFSFDLSGIEALKDDEQQKVNVAKGMIESGMTVNEVRQKVWKLGPLTGGNKSKVIEGFSKPSFFGASAPKGEEKDAVQPDTVAISDIEPTKDTFEQRVAQLVSEAVNQGVPFQQAVEAAIDAALAEGFVPSHLTNPDPLLNKPDNAPTPGADDKKKDELIETPKEFSIPGFDSKDKIVQYWKDLTEDGVKDFLAKRDEEVDAFFKRLQPIFTKNISKTLKQYGLFYKVKADDIINEDELEKFTLEEAKNLSKAMQEAIQYGYLKSAIFIEMDYPNEEANKVLKKIATRNVKSVVGTTKDQIKKVIVDGHEKQLSLGEIASNIRDKFDEISEGRANTIVRTEVLTAVSVGQSLKTEQFQKEFPEQSKRMLRKWLSAQDDKVRDSHDVYDGMEALEVGEEFSDGLKFPRDPDCKDAGEVINCRCAFIDYLPEDAEDIQNILDDNSPLANEGNNWLGQGNPEEKGGQGSGGARLGAGRPRSATVPNKAESLALERWTGLNHDRFITADQRKERNKDNDNLNDWLSKQPPYSGEVVRVLSFSDKLEWDGAVSQYEEDMSDYTVKHKESWSKNESSANIRVSSYKIILKVKDNKKGVDISHLSQRPEEEEILMPKDTKYSVKSTHVRNDKVLEVELSHAKEKGGAGSGGARSGAGRPRTSNPAERLRSFVSNHMDNLNQSGQVEALHSAFNSSKPLVFGAVQSLDEAKSVMKENQIQYDRVEENGFNSTFILKDDQIIAELDSKNGELKIHRNKIPMEQIQSWDSDKIKREMIDLVETDPKVGKEWKQRARDSYDESQPSAGA